MTVSNHDQTFGGPPPWPQGYWQASDGQWYPPHTRPDAAASTSQPYSYVGSAASASPRSNGMAVAAMVLGIISVLGFWALGLGVAIGIVAVVLGAAVLAGHHDGRGSGRGQAMAGVALGVIGIIAGGVFLTISVMIADDIDTDPSDGRCNSERYFQDPDC